MGLTNLSCGVLHPTPRRIFTTTMMQGDREKLDRSAAGWQDRGTVQAGKPMTVNGDNTTACPQGWAVLFTRNQSWITL